VRLLQLAKLTPYLRTPPPTTPPRRRRPLALAADQVKKNSAKRKSTAPRSNARACPSHAQHLPRSIEPHNTREPSKIRDANITVYGDPCWKSA
jgi:hypothetical protein